MVFILSWKMSSVGRGRGVTWTVTVANYVDLVRVAGGSSPQLLWCQQCANRLSLMPLARKAQPDVPVAAMSSTHGSLITKDLSDPEKQTGWPSWCLSRTGEAFDHWARRAKGREASVLPESGWNWPNCHSCTSYSNRARDIRDMSWPKLKKSCSHFSNDDDITRFIGLLSDWGVSALICLMVLRQSLAGINLQWSPVEGIAHNICTYYDRRVFQCWLLLYFLILIKLFWLTSCSLLCV